MKAWALFTGKKIVRDSSYDPIIGTNRRRVATHRQAGETIRPVEIKFLPTAKRNKS